MIELAGLDDNIEYDNFDEKIAASAKTKISQLAEAFISSGCDNNTVNQIDESLSDLEKVMYASNNEQSCTPNQQLVSEMLMFQTMCYQSSLTGVSFWKQFGGKMTLLQRIYMHIKSIMPSNTSIERMFSESSLVLSDLRQNMLDGTLESHLMLNHKC